MIAMARRLVLLSEASLAALRGRIEEEPGGRVSPGPFPGDRERDDYIDALVTTRFCRYESTNGYVTVGDAYAEIIEFSAVPDSVEIFVLDNDIEIQFLNVRGGKNESVTLPADTHWEPGIVYRSLVARNLTAGVAGRIQVVAKWVYR